MKTTRKGLVLLLALVMSLCVMSFTASATETDPVAKIGDTEYATLQAAIDAAKDGETITVLPGTVEPVYINKSAIFYQKDLVNIGKSYTFAQRY